MRPGRFTHHSLNHCSPRTLPCLASPKVQIIGIGDDGLDGLTAAARQIVEQAEVLDRRSAIARQRRRPTKPKRSKSAAIWTPIVRKIEAAGGKRVVDARDRRPAVLWHGPLSLRSAGQGPLRGHAARQQHAARLRPRQGKLGRRLPDEPRHAAAGAGRRKGPHGGQGRPLHDRSRRRRSRRPGPARPQDRLFHGLRLRESRLTGRARHAAAIWPKSPSRNSRR